MDRASLAAVNAMAQKLDAIQGIVQKMPEVDAAGFNLPLLIDSLVKGIALLPREEVNKFRAYVITALTRESNQLRSVLDNVEISLRDPREEHQPNLPTTTLLQHLDS